MTVPLPGCRALWARATNDVGRHRSARAREADLLADPRSRSPPRKTPHHSNTQESTTRQDTHTDKHTDERTTTQNTHTEKRTEELLKSNPVLQSVLRSNRNLQTRRVPSTQVVHNWLRSTDFGGLTPICPARLMKLRRTRYNQHSNKFEYRSKDYKEFEVNNRSQAHMFLQAFGAQDKRTSFCILCECSLLCALRLSMYPSVWTLRVSLCSLT